MKYIHSILAISAVSFLICISSPTGRADFQDEHSGSHPKFIFLFIGDGMATPQIHATEAYLGFLAQNAGNRGSIKVKTLAMTGFPVLGMQKSSARNSFITGSAAAGTALACGIKTNINIISMYPDARTPCTTLAESARAQGMKVGIVTSVSLDHATPAVFYAHTSSRMAYQEIDRQLLRSGFDYFAGGGFISMNDVEKQAAANGFVYVDTRAEFDGLKPGSGKIIAVNPYLDHSKAIPYALNRLSADGPGEDYEGSITLAEFTQKGIQLLNNDNGFFMMVEGGKIDWACHANDARAVIEDIIALDDAVKAALDFADRHPSETLIIVTGDHETGGLALGSAGTAYEAHYKKMEAQKLAFDDFNSKILALYKNAHTPAPDDIDADMWKIIMDYFGMDGSQLTPDSKDDLSEYEIKQLEEAFDLAMTGINIHTEDENRLLYGTYNPLSVTLTHLLNSKSGLGWTSYAHTALPVPVFAIGIGSNIFDGYYDNSDVARKIFKIMGSDTGF
jgi:alkaline phosphatase